MSIEQSVFSKYTPNYELLPDVGFTFDGSKYVIKKLFMDNQFSCIITIDKGGSVKGRVYDSESREEYVPLKLDFSEGSFVAEVRIAYENLLLDIREKCFIKQFFISAQSNRITNLIMKKYGSKPEFLWEQFDGSGVFRNKKSGKWYAAILEVDRGKLQAGKKGKVEVVDLKLDKEQVQKIIKKPGFYPGYHMNKKYWISIILDDSVSDEEIMGLIEISYILSESKNNKI